MIERFFDWVYGRIGDSFEALGAAAVDQAKPKPPPPASCTPRSSARDMIEFILKHFRRHYPEIYAVDGRYTWAMPYADELIVYSRCRLCGARYTAELQGQSVAAAMSDGKRGLVEYVLGRLDAARDAHACALERMTVAFRALSPDDRTFVIDAWVKSFRLADAAGIIGMENFHRVYWPEVERILGRPGVETLVAYETEEPPGVADIYGFASAEVPRYRAPLVHYVYVKEASRGAGIARRMLAEMGVDLGKPIRYTFRTGVVPELIEARKIIARWTPLAAR